MIILMGVIVSLIGIIFFLVGYANEQWQRAVRAERIIDEKKKIIEKFIDEHTRNSFYLMRAEEKIKILQEQVRSMSER